MWTGWSWRRRIVIDRILIFWAYGLVVVPIIVIIVILVAFGRWMVRIVGLVVDIVWCRWRVRSIVVLAILRALLVLAVLHLGFFKQTTLFGGFLAFGAVFDLIRADEGVGRDAEDVFILAELADPEVIACRAMVIVSVLLLKLALASC